MKSIIIAFCFLLFSCQKTNCPDGVYHKPWTCAEAEPATPVISKISVQLLLNDKGGAENTADGVVCSFSKDYSYNIGDEDSYKWPNYAENLAIIKDTKAISINGQPLPISGSDTIFLKIWNYKQDRYVLKINEENFPKNVKVYVYDAWEKRTEWVHKEYNIYYTTLTTDEADEDRFSLIVENI